MATKIDGLVEPGFEGVRDAFQRNFDEHDEIGAGFSLHVEGRKVVDLWGGVAEEDIGRPYTEDTLQLVFSTTKGATATCLNLLIQRGLIDPDAPVAKYWPEFAQGGKESIPVRWLMGHKAGLVTVDKHLSLDEVLAWDPIIEALEVQEPLWEPGSAHGYHAVTFGWLLGELIRKVDGRGLGQFFKEEIAEPLGLEFWIGFPESEEYRVAPMVGSLIPDDSEVAPEMKELFAQFVGPDSLLGRALTLNGAFETGSWNSRKVHAAEIGAANGITNARSLSRMYAGLVGPLADAPAAPLFTKAQTDLARTTQTSGPDKCLFMETTFGLGYMTSSVFAPYGGAGSFGHAGAGGSVGFADPDNGVAVGYVMNKMLANLSGDPRTRGLIKASYDAVGAPIAFV
ncbi:MAG TPA: serine hydrolase domain-containing protein [Acidimicrobiales bacterium]|jgi:CubicO group peptidase (beta-lactamase class C family)|nr:serine hydrolase domain-containing protein [Acidimicrobiales bacterium]